MGARIPGKDGFWPAPCESQALKCLKETSCVAISHGRGHRFESCAAHSTYGESGQSSVQNSVQNVTVRAKAPVVGSNRGRKTFPGRLTAKGGSHGSHRTPLVSPPDWLVDGLPRRQENQTRQRS